MEFFAGVFVGGILGVVIMALNFAAKSFGVEENELKGDSDE